MIYGEDSSEAIIFPFRLIILFMLDRFFFFFFFLFFLFCFFVMSGFVLYMSINVRKHTFEHVSPAFAQSDQNLP